MKKKLFTGTLILALISIASAVSAQTHTPEITKRQENQQARIAQGVKSGQLTAKESEHLESREAKIRHDKKMAKSDGKVTHAEREKLRHEENRTSKAIYHQKHDAQHR